MSQYESDEVEDVACLWQSICRDSTVPEKWSARKANDDAPRDLEAKEQPGNPVLLHLELSEVTFSLTSECFPVKSSSSSSSTIR